MRYVGAELLVTLSRNSRTETSIIAVAERIVCTGERSHRCSAHGPFSTLDVIFWDR